MEELFSEPKPVTSILNQPLADRVRPMKIEDVVGQEHLLGVGAPLRIFFEERKFPSMIFWGPPGVGKTTFAYLISQYTDYQFERISAVEAGVKEVRQILAKAEMLRKKGKKTLLFIDEIHRFNKLQQDALLHAVEKGVVTLLGATTENPSFDVISALLSRCQVYRLQLLSNDNLKQLIENALSKDEILNKYKFDIEAWDFIFAISSGDARAALNAIELAFNLTPKKEGEAVKLTVDLLQNALQQKTAYYDKLGETHYDTISAFIKSLRGSDPDAAIFWLAKMLSAGEDPRFIARRMVVFASEDIGNAEPFALSLAISVFHACELIGMPECRINLAQGATYLASCLKSNASYMAITKAMQDVEQGTSLIVPLHLRNAPTKLMKDEGYSLGYKYPHDFSGHFIKENYFPVGTEPVAYYKPIDSGREKAIKERLESYWGERYKKKESK
jgi:putative ATPase